MTFKVGQWVVVDTTISYWPASAKNNKGPFQIKGVYSGTYGKYAFFHGAPNNAYFKDLTLYKPQVGDKVKILKPMNGFVEHPNILKDHTGKIGIITNIQSLGGEKNIIDIQCEDESHGWWYMDEENVYYELVEPKGSINTAAPEPPSTPVVTPTKRVLNDNV